MWSQPRRTCSASKNKLGGFKPQRFGRHQAHWLVQPQFHTFWHGIPTRRWSCAVFDYWNTGQRISYRRPNNATEDRKSCQIPQNSLKKFQSNEALVWARCASLRTAKYQFVKTLQWLWSEATKLLAGSMQFNWGGKKKKNRKISTSKLKKKFEQLS